MQNLDHQGGMAGNINYIAPVLRVDDLARSLSFYRDRLGFAVEFEHEGFYAGVIREGCRIHLKCAAPSERDQAAFEAAEHLDVCVAVADAATLAAQLESLGAPLSIALRSMPYGKEFYVRDPDGYILGFIERPDPH